MTALSSTAPLRCAFRTAAAVLPALLALVVLASPHEAGVPAQATQFRAGVELVQIDVSVLDRDRRPVRGLTASDFTVLEDGRPQPIAAFSEIVVPASGEAATPWLRDVAADVRRNDDASERRLVVIVMDDMTIPFDPRIVGSARSIARGLVERMGAADLGAVIFTRDNRGAQDFTPDRARLLAAIDRFSAGARDLAPAEEGVQTHYFLSAIDTLGRAAEYLAAIPQRRKTLVYVSVGVPFDAEAAAEPVLIGPGEAARAAVARRDLHARLRDRLSEALRAAGRANVNIYSVDPAGVGGLESAVQQAMMRRADRPSADVIDATAARQATLYADFLQVVAENTGGRAVLQTNDFGPGLDQIFRENGSYYLIGVRPGSPPAPGAFRRLDVRVAREGVDVRARSGYYGTRDRTASAAAPPPLTAALAGVLPQGDLAMQAGAAPFAVAGRQEAAVAVVLAVRQPVPEGRGTLREDVRVSINAFGPEGQPRGAQRLNATLTLRPTGADAQYEVLSRIDLRPGRYQLRIAAESALLARAGSVYYDLDVPDFGREPLSLSGLVLSVDPSPASAPRDRLATLLPVVPTTRREFGRTDRVTAFVRVYQGGRSALRLVTTRVAVIDAAGRTVVDRSTSLAPDDFGGGREADWRFDVPVAALAPGPHLLAIDAVMPGGSGRRAVRFDVR